MNDGERRGMALMALMALMGLLFTSCHQKKAFQ